MMLLSRHYEEIENLCGNKFTLNAQSCDDFMTSEIQNEHVWISTPVESTAEYLQQYLKNKNQNPHTLSACVLMAKWARRELATQLKGMGLLKELQKDSQVFGCSEPDSDQIVELKRCPWPTQIYYYYYDPPRPHLCNFGHGSFVSVVAGSLGGSSACFHIDTLAAENFVSTTFAKQIGLALQKHQQQIILADGTEAKTDGIGTYKLKLGNFVAPITFLATELDTGIDIILGQSFCQKHKVVIDFERQSCFLRKGVRKCSVRFVSSQNQISETQNSGIRYSQEASVLYASQALYATEIEMLSCECQCLV